MKLVEILARELEKWPESTDVVGQSRDGSLHLNASSVSNKGFTAQKFTMAEDWLKSDVTRSDWKAERARIAKPAKKADKDGWIRHRGGKCPVEGDVLLQIVMRSESKNSFDEEPNLASEWEWEHNGLPSDLMYYRLHKPAEQPAPVSEEVMQVGIDAADAGKLTTIEDVKARFTTDGPLQWRDRIQEIDRTIEALEEERVSLIQRLADEGLQLLQGKVCGEVQPVEDMSDPTNWRKGDLITFIEKVGEQCFTTGKQYVFEELDGYGSAGVLADDEGDENGWSVEYFQWHSRPST